MSETATVTIAEVKAAKDELSESIRQAMRAFTQKTSMSVDSIDIRPVWMYGITGVDYTVELDIKL
jgi:hypothetical protein